MDEDRKQMLEVFNTTPAFEYYNISDWSTQTVRKYFIDQNLGGPSFLEFGPDKIKSPVEESVMTQPNDGFYRIMNLKLGTLSAKDAPFYIDIWFLATNLTPEETKAASLEKTINELSGIGEYFLGPMVFVKQDKSRYGGRFAIVDGQQRLTTITMVFCIIRDFMIKYSIQLENNPKSELTKFD